MSNSHISNTNKYAKNVVLGTVGALGLFAIGTQGVKADTVKVKSGDTVWDFSQKYGVSVSDIEARNTSIKKISSSVDLIYAGQTLNLSKMTTVQSSAAVSAAASSASTSSTSSVINGKYTVQNGDTLSALSARFGVSVETLKQANGLSDSNLIVVGQVLNLSSDVAVSASAANSTAASASESSTTNDASVSASSEAVSSAASTVTSSGATSATSVANSTAVSSSSSANTYVSSSSSSVAVTSSAAASATTSSNTATSQSSSVANSSNNNTSTTANTNSDLQTGSVVSLAVKLANAGIPYVWGGNSLSGMDCSGLVQYVYAHSAGINLPHNTVAQEAYVNKHSVASAQPGDILFWGDSGATYHNAIYIGNNQYVAAPTSGQNVKVQTISSYFMPSFAGTIK